MKISLMTMHAVPNYGSVLQTYATVKVLEELGHNVEILNYVPIRLKLFNVIFNESKKKNKLLFPLYFGYSALVNLPKRRMYDLFLAKYLNLSSNVYHSSKEVRENLPDSDLFITGSDQVWNTYYDGFIDPAFFLDFVPKTKRKISFASSFGRGNIESNEEAILKPYLMSYDALSVREFSGVEIINKMGRSDVEHVLDPTFLLDKERWSNMYTEKRFQDRYILMYTVNKDEHRLIKLVKEIARAKGLKIYYLHNGLKGIKGVDRIFRNQSPNEFLNLFAQADYIMATSFHGTAFALNFNIPFVSVLPEKFQARVKSILDLVGLNERMITNDFSLNKALLPIDFEPVNEILIRERSKSINFLQRNIY